MDNNYKKEYMDLVEYIEYMQDSLDFMRTIFDADDLDLDKRDSLYSKKILELFDGLTELISKDLIEERSD